MVGNFFFKFGSLLFAETQREGNTCIIKDCMKLQQKLINIQYGMILAKIVPKVALEISNLVI